MRQCESHAIFAEGFNDATLGVAMQTAREVETRYPHFRHMEVTLYMWQGRCLAMTRKHFGTVRRMEPVVTDSGWTWNVDSVRTGAVGTGSWNTASRIKTDG